MIDSSGWYYFDFANRTVGGPIREEELKNDVRFKGIDIESSEIALPP